MPAIGTVDFVQHTHDGRIEYRITRVPPPDLTVTGITYRASAIALPGSSLSASIMRLFKMACVYVDPQEKAEKPWKWVLYNATSCISKYS